MRVGKTLNFMTKDSTASYTILAGAQIIPNHGPSNIDSIIHHSSLTPYFLRIRKFFDAVSFFSSLNLVSRSLTGKAPHEMASREYSASTAASSWFIAATLAGEGPVLDWGAVEGEAREVLLVIEFIGVVRR